MLALLKQLNLYCTLARFLCNLMMEGQINNIQVAQTTVYIKSPLLFWEKPSKDVLTSLFFPV